MKQLLIAVAALTLACSAAAKLPAPVLTDEAKAKAAEAAAKTAHGNKVANYQLCKSIDRTAEHYQKTAKAAGKTVKPPAETPACADPGPFVAAGAPGAAPVAVAAPAPAAGAAAPKAATAPAAPAKKS
jgi:hypothetical protein